MGNRSSTVNGNGDKLDMNRILLDNCPREERELVSLYLSEWSRRKYYCLGYEIRTEEYVNEEISPCLIWSWCYGKGYIYTTVPSNPSVGFQREPGSATILFLESIVRTEVFYNISFIDMEWR